VDCVDGGVVVVDAGTPADAAQPMYDTGTTGGPDGGGKKPDAGTAAGDESSGCSCATLQVGADG
jgi:hypothetical protein